jgi:hypothetical protein
MENQKMSWKVEVIADASGKWCDNAVRLATREEAEAEARSLASRWLLVERWRVVESDEPPNYTIVDGKIREIESHE